MIKVKVSIPDLSIPIFRQSPNNSCIWNNCQFFINEDVSEVDAWFVLDSLSSNEETSICRRGNVFLVTGEPPSVKLYSDTYIKQFDRVFTCQKNLLNKTNALPSHPFLPWMVGAHQLDGMNLWDRQTYLNYDFFSQNCIQNKIDEIAVITSNKRITRGHCKRLNFIEQICSALPGVLHIYGNGFEPVRDKYDVYSKYKYCLVIENCCYPNYWTEKIVDAYLAECFPLYVGDPLIDEYFPSDSLMKLDINNTKDSIESIKHCINSDIWNQNHTSVLESKDLCLNKYNLFNSMCEMINKYADLTQERETITLTTRNDLKWKLSMRFNKLLSKYV